MVGCRGGDICGSLPSLDWSLFLAQLPETHPKIDKSALQRSLPGQLFMGDRDIARQLGNSVKINTLFFLHRASYWLILKQNKFFHEFPRK